jgi:23S rRNA (adenine2030-N6)-methyltransferase
MFIINPPWTLNAELKQTLPWLVSNLGVDARAAYKLDFLDK